MNVRFAVMTLAAVVTCASCGGSGGASTMPTAPSVPSATTPGTTTVTINIVGDKGNLSFSPNPATVPAGQVVVWKNTDSIVHRVVIDGLIDTGNLAPGASSAPMPLGDVSKSYHCSIHPGMVGSLNGAETSTPANCTDPYGNGCRP